MKNSTFYVTNGVTQDGFGARFQRCIQAMCLVYQLRSQGTPAEYVHTPFSYDEDNEINEDRTIGVGIRQDFTLANAYPYDDISHEGYMKRSLLWDKALGFKGKTIYDLDLSKLTVKHGCRELLADCAARNTARSLYVVRYSHKEYDSKILDINSFSTYRNEILNSFDFKKKKSTKKEIAIHIRRKDIIDKEHRHLTDSYYLTFLSELEKLKKKYNVTIYTQEVGFDASLYLDWNVVFDSKEEDYTTFKKLVSADHLVVGSSSFSYAAALLNPNLVVYPYMTNSHIGLDSWITASKYLNLLKTDSTDE